MVFFSKVYNFFVCGFLIPHTTGFMGSLSNAQYLCPVKEHRMIGDCWDFTLYMMHYIWIFVEKFTVCHDDIAMQIDGLDLVLICH